ncbi:Hypothetical protein A7982_04410 [Minicystis rosea]|nr:Hypothetical protein A7982_04410 [Minicystis rosea]
MVHEVARIRSRLRPGNCETRVASNDRGQENVIVLEQARAFGTRWSGARNIRKNSEALPIVFRGGR